MGRLESTRENTDKQIEEMKKESMKRVLFGIFWCFWMLSGTPCPWGGLEATLAANSDSHDDGGEAPCVG